MPVSTARRVYQLNYKGRERERGEGVTWMQIKDIAHESSLENGKGKQHSNCTFSSPLNVCLYYAVGHQPTQTSDSTAVPVAPEVKYGT